jgi:hypothetical protein
MLRLGYGGAGSRWYCKRCFDVYRLWDQLGYLIVYVDQ